MATFLSYVDHYILAIGRFAFIGIHTQPSEAVREIDALADVYDDIKGTFNIEVNSLMLHILYIYYY